MERLYDHTQILAPDGHRVKVFSWLSEVELLLKVSPEAGIMLRLALYSWLLAASLGLAPVCRDTCCRSEGVRQSFSRMMSTSSSSSSSLSPSAALLLWERQSEGS